MADVLPTAYLNGEFLPVESARISPLDRGFLFGDAVYEVIPVFGGKALLLDAHLARLARSLEALGITDPLSASDWQALISRLAEENGGLDHDLIDALAKEASVDRRRIELLATGHPWLKAAGRVRAQVFVCEGASCFRARCDRIVRAAEEALGLPLNEVSPDGQIRLLRANCLGGCESSPCMEVNGKLHEEMTPERVRELLQPFHD